MVQGRLRAALLAGAVLAGTVPLLAHATAPHLTCGVRQTGSWERIPVHAFRTVNGVPGQDSITAYTVDEQKGQSVAATNGARIQVSTSHGCSWSDSFALSPTPTSAQPFPGVTSKIVTLGLMGSRRLAAVQEGSGSASRPHVMVQSGGSWRASDGGLPLQGAPRLLRVAGDGRTAYLTISPTASGGSDSGTTTGIIPGLPGGPTDTPTGLLYATTDGGASWELRTGAGDVPSGGTGFTALDIDPGNSNVLYGIVQGQLLVSRNGGATFSNKGGGVRAITALGPSALAAFTSTRGLYSSDAGAHFSAFKAPGGVTSVASRVADSGMVVESSGVLYRVELNGLITRVPAASPARTGSLLGDRGRDASFHALTGHSLLRYVDAVPVGTVIPPIAVGDLTVPPPRAGAVSPAVRNVSLPVGSAATEEFLLNLPANPTPLDLFFVVDVSASMQNYITDLKTNINRIVAQLEARKIDLKVGVASLGTGPARGENEYPDAYVFPPEPDLNHPGQTKPGKRYVRPRVYTRLREVGQTGPTLQKAINSITIETTAPRTGCQTECQPREGALLALEQAATGSGVRSLYEERLGLSSKTAVPPGQQAGFRGNPDVRRVIILATNEPFDIPYDTPQKSGSTPSDPKADPTRTIRILNQNHIQVIGLSAGESMAAPDLRAVSRGTRTFAPPGGLNCGGDPIEVIAAGAPLVCNTPDQFANVIVRLLSSLVDRQRVSLVPRNRTPVLGFIDGGRLGAVDVKRPSATSFSVRVSCVDVKPGRYAQDVSAVLRQTIVGRARLNVTCIKAASLPVPPKPVTIDNPPPPPPQPVPNPIPPPAPAPPAAQPQVQPQVQTQVQVQPLTAGAIQEQQELQLALALNGTLKDDDPAFNPGQQMAMVDRRKREQVQALGVLAFAMTACAGIGLARLRARPDPAVRRVR